MNEEQSAKFWECAFGTKREMPQISKLIDERLGLIGMGDFARKIVIEKIDEYLQQYTFQATHVKLMSGLNDDSRFDLERQSILISTYKSIEHEIIDKKSVIECFHAVGVRLEDDRLSMAAWFFNELNEFVTDPKKILELESRRATSANSSSKEDSSPTGLAWNQAFSKGLWEYFGKLGGDVLISTVKMLFTLAIIIGVVFAAYLMLR